ncbi:flavodoxin family protein [Anaerocolumna xylanovorans]|uniref:Multimeric flavodoxin WrbA n=1 Tax=Anaerocolumna xylanovorans DSM 12503 TaxID=1121345 RepID=A0A1M7YGV9_9FIRM|nr:flavodoxin family protein [Anaerocolumna xylanovorans]SHO51887.1 Multimeric flavodoxin WrbA [Anaerocolumna xylanovorans DSM 12503]
MLRTIIFNGSPRKNGDTKSILNEFVKYLDGEYKIVDTYYCNIKPCLDCRYCWENTGCCQKDEWQEIDQYIRECDNIVIASPIYFSELTGQLLNAVSKVQSYWSARYFRKEEIITKCKKGGIILIGGGDGHMSTPIEMATCILHHMKVKNIAPEICCHDTNNQPAINQDYVINAIKEMADFLNKK